MLIPITLLSSENLMFNNTMTSPSPHTTSAIERKDHPWHVVYSFINNRCQSVRQDITYQVWVRPTQIIHWNPRALANVLMYNK